MDLRSFLTTFGLVFLAELGDKTQLATMSMAATGGQKWLVFAAAALALVLSSLIAVLVGDLLRSRIDPLMVQRCAAGMFLVLGGLMLVDTFRTHAPEAAPPEAAPPERESR